MIKKIVLENYMSHGRTVIEPADGLTVLVGPNNCGKSAVVSALQTLCYNRSGDFMVRHGAKECSVTIEMDSAGRSDDGTRPLGASPDGGSPDGGSRRTITWRRKRNVVSYIVDGTDIHRLGRSVPQSVQDGLRLSRVKAADGTEGFDIHFGEQKSPIFLLNEPDSRAATFFASSSDAEKLLEMQRRHREQVAAAKSDAKRTAKEIEAVDALLAFLAPVPDVAADVARLDAECGSVEAAVSRAEALRRALAVRTDWIEKFVRCGTVSRALDGLEPTPVLGDVPGLSAAIVKLRESLKRQGRETGRVRALVSLLAPPALDDDIALERAIRNLTTAGRRRDRAGRSKSALEPLETPPVQPDVQTLGRVAAALRDAERRHARARRRADALSVLPSIPDVRDRAPQDDFLRRWRRALDVLRDRGNALASADRELAECRGDVEAWASRNPNCPVCRGPIDADRLLSPAHLHEPAPVYASTVAAEARAKAPASPSTGGSGHG